MATTDLCLNTVCTQRLRQMLFTVPPTRFTPISPYPQYTQQQLNMRRKAEILNYGASKSNTKTNNYTKAEKYKLLVSGVYQSTTYPNTVETIESTYVSSSTSIGSTTKTTFTQNIIKATAGNCISKRTIQTPTTSSDVPGPIQYLYMDTTVPLYNYATQTRSYSSEPVSDTVMWSTLINENQYCPNGIPTTIFSIGILDPIDQDSYTFTYSTPIVLTYSATVPNSTKNIFVPNNTFSITSAKALVYYSNQLVKYTNPACTIYDSTMAFDVSMTFDVSFTPIANTNSTAITAISNPTGLTINNLSLFTSPGYIYDIQLLFTTNISNNNFTNQKMGVICNYTGDSSDSNTNTILNFTPTTTLTTYSLTGV